MVDNTYMRSCCTTSYIHSLCYSSYYMLGLCTLFLNRINNYKSCCMCTKRITTTIRATTLYSAPLAAAPSASSIAEAPSHPSLAAATLSFACLATIVATRNCGCVARAMQHCTHRQ